MDLCAECGFGGDGVPLPVAIGALADFGPSLLELFGRAPESVLRQRPELAVWSALEYACHTGEAVAWYHERIGRVLLEFDPVLRPFDWDAACVKGEYNKRLVAVAAEAAERACSDLAKLLASLKDAAWSRRGIGSDGSARSVAGLARRAAHEAVHHHQDIRRAIAVAERR